MSFRGFFQKKDTFFGEMGAGDCSFSFEGVVFKKGVCAVVVCEKITKNARPPLNFRLILSDGCSIPLPRASVNVCYSNQLMEHLHPDDALEQLENIVKVLVPGGVYICITPNRLTGPHDISRHFDAVATGFHLREYTRTELRDLFKAAGFSRNGVYLAGTGKEQPLRSEAVG